MEKQYTIFGGVNGAGKSTLFKHNAEQEFGKRINSDEILREKGNDWRDNIAQADAMKEAVRRINTCLKNETSFNQETTLVGSSIINTINKAKEKGYKINLYYVGLESADTAIQRVAHRVKEGGHGIEEADIRRRYENSLENLDKIIPLCDNVEIFDNTKMYKKIAAFENGQLTYKKDCEWFDKHVNIKDNVAIPKEKTTAMHSEPKVDYTYSMEKKKENTKSSVIVNTETNNDGYKRMVEYSKLLAKPNSSKPNSLTHNQKLIQAAMREAERIETSIQDETEFHM